MILDTRNMRKTWRNPRQVIVNQAPAEPEDSRRRERLVALLATGMERLLSQEDRKSPKAVDFTADSLVNTCTVRETTKTESA